MEEKNRKVLNVGGNNKDIPIPPHYDGWEHVLLDIDPANEPDLVCDARELMTIEAGQYDAVYCSHNLEHYYRHHVPSVLGGFFHILNAGGFAEIRVPDIDAVMKTVVQRNLDIDDVLYQSRAGPITVNDVLYGWGAELERSGNDFYSHKTGFTAKSLGKFLHKAGFLHIYSGVGKLEIRSMAFKAPPDDYQKQLFKLADS